MKADKLMFIFEVRQRIYVISYQLFVWIAIHFFFNHENTVLELNNVLNKYMYSKDFLQFHSK